jgi:hypothetical protein
MRKNYIRNVNKIRVWLAVIAETLDYFRVVPRLIIVGYGYLVWSAFVWFREVDKLSMEHTIVISSLLGISGLVVGMYVNSGKNWNTPLVIWSDDKADNVIAEKGEYVNPTSFSMNTQYGGGMYGSQYGSQYGGGMYGSQYGSQYGSGMNSSTYPSSVSTGNNYGGSELSLVDDDDDVPPKPPKI